MFVSMADVESMGSGHQFRVYLVPPVVNATGLTVHTLLLYSPVGLDLKLAKSA